MPGSDTERDNVAVRAISGDPLLCGEWAGRTAGYPQVGSRGAHSINVDRCPVRQLAGHHPPRRRGFGTLCPPHRGRTGGAGPESRCSALPTTGRRPTTSSAVSTSSAAADGSVYPRALLHVLRHRPRLVVDVQNGLPFGSSLVTGRPVVVLVHHVHREQWPILFGRLGGALGCGWSRSWPRGSTGAAVTSPCPRPRRRRARRARDRPRPALRGAQRRGAGPAGDLSVLATPHLVVLGRLVLHKRVEHADRGGRPAARPVAGPAPVRGR